VKAAPEVDEHIIGASYKSGFEQLRSQLVARSRELGETDGGKAQCWVAGDGKTLRQVAASLYSQHTLPKARIALLATTQTPRNTRSPLPSTPHLTHAPDNRLPQNSLESIESPPQALVFFLAFLRAR